MSTDIETSSPPAAPGPDWSAVTEEIRCPLCDYNLRGLDEPRCPECGYKFAWPELIDPAHRLHPYLFEHHPERRAWSFWRTLTAGLRHRRFWKALHPAQPSYPRRLIFYCLLAMLPLALGVAANICSIAIEIRRANQAVRPSEKAWLLNPRYKVLADSMIKQFGSIENYLDSTYPVAWLAVFQDVRRYGEALPPLFVPAGLAVAWPWATLAGLLVFQISMRRARVRLAHVLRCVCYAADISFWLGFAMTFTALPLAIVAPVGNLPMFTVTKTIPLEMLSCLGALLVFTGRLITAYRQYLRIPRPLWVIVAAEAIAFLLVLNLFVILIAIANES